MGFSCSRAPRKAWNHQNVATARQISRFVTFNAFARSKSQAMQVTTIGFTQKSAAQFFTLLKQAEVRTLLDVRLNNTSQLAGFSKKPDLEFFLSELLDIRYVELRELAPERDHLERYRSGDLSSKTCRRILEFTMVQLLEHRTFTVTPSCAHFLSAIGNAYPSPLNGFIVSDRYT